MEQSVEARFKADLLGLLPRIRAFARTLAGGPDAGDDLAQDTVLRAWRGRDGFTPGSNMEAWLFRILRNAHISGVRRTDRCKSAPIERLEDALAGADDPSAYVQFDDMRRAIMRLPEAQREALILIGAVGWSYDEAAKHAGCAVGTLKSRVFRARRTLSTKQLFAD